MGRVDKLLDQFGLEPDFKRLQEIRELLNNEIINDRREDNEYLKTLCILLFTYGCAEDSLVIWNAKNIDFDTGCYIDGELLLGAGLDKTIDYLKVIRSKSSIEILEYIEGYKIDDDYMTRDKLIEFYKEYYNLD